MSDIEIPLSVPSLRGNEARYLQECVDTNFVSSVGPFVGRFESEFARYVGAPFTVACASGTAAIHLALRAAGIGAGDEVFVSDFTFIGTVNPITYLGATPVLVDCDRTTWNMDAALLEDELERRARAGSRMPKAVLVAHVLGLMSDLERIAAACERHGIMLIEDAAEALGAGIRSGRFAGKAAGTAGLLGCFSFNGNKILTCGGGGMIATADRDIAAHARHLSTQAKLPGDEYLHDEIGYNYRLTNLAAAVGVAQLEQLDAFVAKKHAIAERYDNALRGIPGVTVPPRPEWSSPSMWLYSILLDEAVIGTGRRETIAHLREHGIGARPLWAPAHLMAFYATSPRLGGAAGEQLFRDGLSLPCSVDLTEDQQSRVLDALMSHILRRP